MLLQIFPDFAMKRLRKRKNHLGLTEQRQSGKSCSVLICLEHAMLDKVRFSLYHSGQLILEHQNIYSEKNSRERNNKTRRQSYLVTCGGYLSIKGCEFYSLLFVGPFLLPNWLCSVPSTLPQLPLITRKLGCSYFCSWQEQRTTGSSFPLKRIP